MLVLTRRNGEQILIAGNIRVAVVAVKGNQVRLGITAPASVPVVRRELLAGCSEGAALPEPTPAPPEDNPALASKP
jgi:carbon storage regulator